MRWLGVAALVLAMGCGKSGKSFVDAEAIYKDELAKLEALESEFESRRDVAAKEEFDAYETEMRRWYQEHAMPKVGHLFEGTADAEGSGRAGKKSPEMLDWEKSRDKFIKSIGGIDARLGARFQGVADEYREKLDEQKARVRKAEQEKEAAKL